MVNSDYELSLQGIAQVPSSAGLLSEYTYAIIRQMEKGKKSHFQYYIPGYQNHLPQ